MTTFTSFPKIFNLGQKYISHLFDEEVEVTEKVDGSQFGFAKLDGEMFVRSKGQMLHEGHVPGMFKLGWDYVHSIADDIPDNHIFYGEFLNKPKHNTLTYGRTPRNNIILFGVCKPDQTFYSKYEDLTGFADMLGIEVVPALYRGNIDDAADVKALMDTESVLGNVKIEGVVIKNYHRTMFIGDVPIPMVCGKYVSDEFKEQHIKGWAKGTGKGKWGDYKDSYRTEARWMKAVQHLRDNGQLDTSNKDIGPLIREVLRDIEDECAEDIKEFLYREFGKELKRTATAGLPEWYKEQLMEGAFA